MKNRKLINIKGLERILYIFLLSMISIAVSAQSKKTITGIITDANNEPLSSVSVYVEGTTIGTSTDLDGNYSLEIAADQQTLTYSYIGFITKNETIGNRTIINVVLMEDSQTLEDVVVVGYGTVKKSHLTGAVSSIKADELPQAATASVGAMMRGRAAGLQINQNSARPGGDMTFQLRGAVTGSAPLIVIDGVPQAAFAGRTTGTIYSGGKKDNTLISLNPNDIESIDILKDASAASIYGSDASGGVILITTKKGKDGKVDISYNSSYAFQTLTDFPDFLNARDFMIQQNNVFDELGRGNEKKFTQDQIDNFVGKGTKWIDEVTRTGFVMEQNLSIRSGTEKQQILASISYFDQKGVAKNNEMNRITGRINYDQKFNNWLKGGINASYAQLKYKDVPLGDQRQQNAALIYSAMTYNPTVPVYDEEGNFSDNPDRPGIYPNPVSLLNIKDEQKDNNISVTAYVEATILKGLTVKAVAGTDYRQVQGNQYIPTTTKEGFEKKGIASKTKANDRLSLLNLIANFNRDFGKNSLSVMAALEYKKRIWDGDGIIANQFPYDGATWNNLQSAENKTVTSYGGSNEMASFVSRINYSFDNKYSATFNMRVDGSSNFAPDHQYGVFPGLSVAWRLSEESFLKDNFNSLSNLKLRFGVGQTGHAGGLTGIFTYYKVLPNSYAFDGNMANGVGMAKIGNPNLKWESLTDYNLGLDFGFFKNRLSGSVELYLRYVNDIILERDLMSYQEIKKVDYNSDARYRTKGIDINIHSDNIINKDFTWSTDINFSYYQNHTVERDADFNPAIYQPYKEHWGDLWKYQSDGLVKEGETVPHQPSAQPGTIKYKDLNGYVRDADGNKVRDENGRYAYTGQADGILDDADFVKIGNTTPIPFSINNTFTYKDFDLNIYLYGSLGGWKRNELEELSVAGITDMTYGLNGLSSVKDRWSPSNPEGNLPSVFQSVAGTPTDEGDFFYERAWYMRLDNLQLGYTIPKKIFKNKLSSVRVYASVRNLFVLTPYGGMDPETGNGIGAYPNQRSFVFGLDVKF